MPKPYKSIRDIPITKGVLNELAEIDKDERFIDMAGERTKKEQQQLCEKVGINFYREFLPALDDSIPYDNYPKKVQKEIEDLQAQPLDIRINTIKKKLNGVFMVRINKTARNRIAWKNKMEECRSLAMDSLDKTLANKLGKRATIDDIFIPSPKGNDEEEYEMDEDEEDENEEDQDEETTINFDEVIKALKKALKAAGK